MHAHAAAPCARPRTRIHVFIYVRTYVRHTHLTPLNSQIKKVYRVKHRIPRQTLYNRKRRKLLNNNGENVDNSSCSPRENTADGLYLDSDTSSDSCIDTTPTPDSSPLITLEEDGNECDSDQLVPSQHLLFPGSTVTTDTSSMVIRSFMCRQRLTYQAKADLLQLLQIHVPETNNLPSLVYMFQKSYTSSCTDYDPLVTEHHYCPSCTTVLSDPSTSVCTQERCGIPLSYNATPYFITVSSDQSSFNRLYAIVSNSLHACAILKGDCIEFATAARAYSLSALST